MSILQVAVLKALLSKENWDTLSSVVTEGWFEDTTAKRMYTTIAAMQPQSTVDITYGALKMHIHSTYKVKTDFRDELVDLVDMMEQSPVEDIGTLQRSIKRLYSRAKSMDAVIYLSSHMDDEDYDPAVPANMLAEAAEMAVTFDAEVLDYAGAVDRRTTCARASLGTASATSGMAT